jgi:glucose-6-phosphate dehydrogenase assembly protein OpcA
MYQSVSQLSSAKYTFSLCFNANIYCGNYVILRVFSKNLDRSQQQVRVFMFPQAVFWANLPEISMPLPTPDSKGADDAVFAGRDQLEPLCRFR